MGFIVYNKDMKGYLKKHGGAYRRRRQHISYDIQKELEENGIYRPPMVLLISYDKYWDIVHKEVSKRIFSATPENAREYLTRGGAINSVGIHGNRLGDKVRLPDNLEIREIGVKIVIVYKGEKS